MNNHRIQYLSLLAISFTMATSINVSAQTTLPYFKTSDNYGGRTVQNMDKFAPTTNDYTIEVVATTGQAISIKSAGVSYTPKTNGKVRFVQQDGKIYVFENNEYTTTLTPIYHYTEGTVNLLRNGSFESVSTELSSGRWQATDWQTWDGGTPTWGSGTGYVNVRENASYRSDGKKSIVLHYKSRWLSQQLTAGTFEANGVYRISCDYWTSSGVEPNGGAKYEFWIGSSLANNDIMSFDGYTTVEYNTAKQSFSTIFQLPDKLSDDIFLSFYRTAINKVDWLDNARLVKVTPSAEGITGASSAIYAIGAYAPAYMSLPDGVGIDYTNRITNSNFNDATMNNSAPAGWTLEGTVGQSKISTGAKADLIPANQNHWQLFQQSGSATGCAYQTISDLPNGKYEVTATVVNYGFGGEMNLIANDGKTTIESNAAKQYTVSGIVVDGKLKLGLSIATTGGFTVDFDTFTLLYKGMDIDGYREVLTNRIASAKEVVANLEEGYDPKDINAAISKAEGLDDKASANDIIACITNIDKVLADYQKYVDERMTERKRIAQFESFVTGAKAERESDKYPGIVAFDEAISKAEDFLAELQANPAMDAATVIAEQDALNEARETYYNSQYKVTPVEQKISTVDLSLNGSEKYVLRVDGKPFYPTEIQVRPDKLRGYLGWNETEVEAAFKRAAEDGFNTLSIPVYWSEVEPEKNHFDWRILDKYLGWCKKYGVKMEMLWFSWSSGGRVQWLWNLEQRKQLRTPDYVCSADGKSEFNMLRTQWEYSLDWRDTNLRSRETYVLGKIMEHIALWDANNDNQHTVIGVQLGNEARAHGSNTATSAEIVDYYHHVGSAVKQSKYVTWTRLNCVSYETSGRTSANENKRKNGGTNIDFVGIDVYGTNASSVKGDINGQLGTNGNNYRMIMEIDAKDANSPIYQMAALAGNKAFDYYNLGPVDGNGLYDADWENHMLVERSHIDLVRQRNKMLNLANQDIALYKQGGSLYVYNYAGNNTNNENGLDGISFTPDANNTQAVAVRHGNSDEVALLSTSGGTFTLPVKYDGYKTQVGYFDQDNQWIAQSDLTISNNKVVMPETSCVLITKTPGVLTFIDSIGTNNVNKQAVAYYSLSGQIVNTPSAGIYITKCSNGTTAKVVLK